MGIERYLCLVRIQYQFAPLFSLLVRSAYSATGDSYSALLTSVPVAEVRKLREAMREATHDQGHS